MKKLFVIMFFHAYKSKVGFYKIATFDKIKFTPINKNGAK
jgi:hypothetical protein